MENETLQPQLEKCNYRDSHEQPYANKQENPEI